MAKYTLIEGARFELYSLLKNVLTISDCGKFAAYADGWDDSVVTKKLITDSKFIKPAEAMDPDIYAAILRKTGDVRVKNFGGFEDRAKATETRATNAASTGDDAAKAIWHAIETERSRNDQHQRRLNAYSAENQRLMADMRIMAARVRLLSNKSDISVMDQLGAEQVAMSGR